MYSRLEERKRRRGSGGEEATSSAVKYSEFFPRSNVQRVLFPVELVS
jgi:hypothetical protein